MVMIQAGSGLDREVGGPAAVAAAAVDMAIATERERLELKQKLLSEVASYCAAVLNPAHLSSLYDLPPGPDEAPLGAGMYPADAHAADARADDPCTLVAPLQSPAGRPERPQSAPAMRSPAEASFADFALPDGPRATLAAQNGFGMVVGPRPASAKAPPRLDSGDSVAARPTTAAEGSAGRHRERGTVRRKAASATRRRRSAVRAVAATAAGASRARRRVSDRYVCGLCQRRHAEASNGAVLCLDCAAAKELVSKQATLRQKQREAEWEISKSRLETDWHGHHSKASSVANLDRLRAMDVGLSDSDASESGSGGAEALMKKGAAAVVRSPSLAVLSSLSNSN